MPVVAVLPPKRTANDKYDRIARVFINPKRPACQITLRDPTMTPYRGVYGLPLYEIYAERGPCTVNQTQILEKDYVGRHHGPRICRNNTQQPN